jgi:hypothetical protein
MSYVMIPHIHNGSVANAVRRAINHQHQHQHLLLWVSTMPHNTTQSSKCFADGRGRVGMVRSSQFAHNSTFTDVDD